VVLAEVTGRAATELSGPMCVDNPGVLTFAKILVCMDCGFSRFTTTEAQLRVLRKRKG
jgi:hypothetical protein